MPADHNRRAGPDEMPDATVRFVVLPRALEILHDVFRAEADAIREGKAGAGRQQDIDSIAVLFKDMLQESSERKTRNAEVAGNSGAGPHSVAPAELPQVSGGNGDIHRGLAA